MAMRMDTVTSTLTHRLTDRESESEAWHSRCKKLLFISCYFVLFQRAVNGGQTKIVGLFGWLEGNCNWARPCSFIYEHFTHSPCTDSGGLKNYSQPQAAASNIMQIFSVIIFSSSTASTATVVVVVVAVLSSFRFHFVGHAAPHSHSKVACLCDG